jgi:hypothetical protein
MSWLTPKPYFAASRRREPFPEKKGHAICKRRKVGTFTRSSTRAKMIAAKSTQATNVIGNGCIAMPRTARREMIRISAIDDTITQTPGRELHI